MLKEAGEGSGKVYSYRKLHDELQDQGSQFSGIDWVSFLKQHNLEHSMSRRGNCYDNAFAESFFDFLECECVMRKC